MAARIDMMTEGRLDSRGYEVPDPTPVALPAGFKEPESLEVMIRRLIRSEEWTRATNEEGFESFEESEDFEIDDDMWDPQSPYEEVFDPVLNRGITLDEFRKNEKIYEERYAKAHAKAYQELDRSEALRGRRRTAPPAEQSGREAPPELKPEKK